MTSLETETAAPHTAGPAATTTGRTLRLVVVPTPQPPLSREPFRWVVPGIRPPRPQHRPGPRPRPAAHLPRDDFGPSWSARTELPDPREAGRRVLTMALEALAARRPLAQLRPFTSVGVFTALSRGTRPRWCAEGTAPLVVGPVHLCEPVDGVAEVSAVARRAGRAHAVAARLEGIDGRWQCTALQIG